MKTMCRSIGETSAEVLPMNFLIYSSQTSVTGRRLGEFFGFEHGTQAPDSPRPDKLLRWGSSRGVPLIPSDDTFNYKDAVNRTTDKFGSLQVLKDAGVPVPNHSRDHRELDYPLLGRDRNHYGGTDIELILQSQDAELCSSDYYVEYIPTQREYRFHVIDGEVVKVSHKRCDEPEDYTPYCRNYQNGHRFVHPPDDIHERAKPIATRAVEALGLDFGALDVILGEDNHFRVLEVNTAPSLSENTFELYAEKLMEMMGLDEDEVNGTEAVTWED